MSIPTRDSIEQSVKTVTSLVGRKLKIKQWKITNTKGTKFGDTNRFIKIRLGAFCNGVNWEKWSEKENLHINILKLIAAKFAILTFTKGQSNIVIHLQIDNKTIFWKWGVHTTENIWSSASPIGVTFSANKLQCLQSTFPVL